MDRTKINWNIFFRAIRSHFVIANRELVDDLFLNERKPQFLHCKTTTLAISTRGSRRPTCNKKRKFMKKKQTINAEKVLLFLAALIPALVFGGKNKKVAGHRIPKKCQKEN